MVERYYCDDEITITEQPGGKYVLFEDYDELEDALRSLLKELREIMGSPCDDCDCELCTAVRSATSVLAKLGGCSTNA